MKNPLRNTSCKAYERELNLELKYTLTYNIYKLKREVNPKLLDRGQMDTHTLSNIQTSKWDTKQKEKAIEILSSVEKAEDRRVALSEMKQKTKEDEK